MCELSLVQGVVCMIGSAVDESSQRISDRSLLPHDLSPVHHLPPHITLLSKPMISAANITAKEALEYCIAQDPNMQWLDLGVGSAAQVYYKIVCWPAGQLILWKFCKRFQIEWKIRDFHITIGSRFGVADAHVSRKNLSTVVYGLEEFDVEKIQWMLDQAKRLAFNLKNIDSDEKSVRRLIFINVLSDAAQMCEYASFLSSSSADTKAIQDYLFEILSLRSFLYGSEQMFKECFADSERMIELNDSHPLGYIRLGEVHSSSYMKDIPKALQFYSIALKLLSKASSFDISGLAQRIEKGIRYIMHLQVYEKIDPSLKFNPVFIEKNSHEVRTVCLARNFSWVIPGQLCGMSLPCKKEQIEALSHLSIKLIFTAMEEQRLSSEFFDPAFDVKNIHYSVKNYQAPTVEQVDDFIAKCEELFSLSDSFAALIHCGGGKGRAGTFLSCWLVKHGKEKYKQNGFQDNPTKMSASDAIAFLRQIRPGSVETTEQEAFINDYSRTLWQRYHNENSPIVEEKDANISLERKKKMRNAPSCIVLMGIPGSGKSSFANHLVSLNSWLVPRNWEHVNQDECGSSSDFWSRLQSCARDKNKRIIVDRCNVKKSDRNQVIEALMLGKSIKGSKDVTLIFFDISKEICYERISNRKDHPTISITKAKTKGEKIISSFSQQLEKPSKDEGFGVIHNITSEEEAHNLLSSWGCDVHSLTSSFFKFPRTHHLLDVGGSSVSRDDLLLDAFELKDYFGPNSKPLLIQEKVDGANLGISITKDFEIRFQNRSHFVNFESGSQWTRLKEWTDMHKHDLYQILEPEKHILFGEWCFAKHSINYTCLPDYFLAFDIYDQHVGKFLSFSRMKDMISKSSLPIYTVPVLSERATFSSKESLISLLNSSSKLYMGYVEGIYLRIESEDFVQKRCKLVRHDFIQNIESHWQKHEMIRNTIDPQFY